MHEIDQGGYTWATRPANSGATSVGLVLGCVFGRWARVVQVGYKYPVPRGFDQEAHAMNRNSQLLAFCASGAHLAFACIDPRCQPA